MNVRSINKNFDETVLFLKELQKDGFSFDIIALTETWQICDTNFFHIDNYTMLYNQGIYNQNDGVVVYVRDCYGGCFTCEIQEIGEIKVQNICLRIYNNKIRIIALYRPPSYNVYEFNTKLQTFLQNTTDPNDSIQFLVGDINIDIKGNKDYANEYLDILTELGYQSLINTYTRVQNGSQSCLDHIFVNSGEITCKSCVFGNDITDHYPVAVVVRPKNCYPTRSQHSPETKIKYIKKLNYTKLQDLLKYEDWQGVYEAQSIESAVDYFITRIQTATQMSMKTIYLKASCKRRQPWITPALIKSVNRKQKLFLDLKNEPNNDIKKESIGHTKINSKNLLNKEKKIIFRI